MDVYQAAMGVAAVQLPGRRAIMQAHTAHPAFRALIVTGTPQGAAGETAAGPAQSSRSPTGSTAATASGGMISSARP